jgi:hypothetical protein
MSAIPRKVAKPSQARERLREVLAALEDPATYCKDNGGPDDARGQASFVMGSARVMIKYALHDLGEPIDPMK